MSEFLFFILGLMIGGLSGITSICLCMINKKQDIQISKTKKDESKN
jgi:hypothetical protein